MPYLSKGHPYKPLHDKSLIPMILAILGVFRSTSIIQNLSTLCNDASDRLLMTLHFAVSRIEARSDSAQTA